MNLFIKKKIILFFFLGMSSTTLWGQGCSDAGFCTLGALRPDQSFNKAVKVNLRSLEISQYVGYTHFDDYIWATTADFNFSVGQKGTFQFKVPYMWINGPLATTSGVGDISLSYSYNIYKSYQGEQISLTIGGKIPTNTANKTSAEGLPLPMYYQTSLGTYDFIIGASYLSRKWLIALGYQQPFNQNGSKFLWATWAGHPQKPIADLYPQAHSFERGRDAMVRIERNFRFSRFNFNIAFLGIYHLNKDKFTNAKGERITVANTTGFVQNGLLGAGYRFSTKSAIKLVYGLRLNERKKNPDGLSREWVATIGYQFNF